MADNGITEKSFLLKYRRILEAKQRKRDLQKEANGEGGVIRAALKEIEEEGGSKIAMKLLDLITNIENEAEREAALRDAFKFGAWIGTPIWHPGTEEDPQGAMFASDEGTRDARQGVLDHAIEMDARTMRQAGGTLADNPWQPGERNRQTWDQGWRDADFDMQGKPKGPVTANTAPRGRGRPAGAKNKAPEAKAKKGGKKAAADTIGETAGSA